jgi:hypothetical protein
MAMLRLRPANSVWEDTGAPVRASSTLLERDAPKERV